MDVSLSDHGPISVLGVGASRIDAASAIRFKDLVREVTPKDAETVVLDLSKVNFIDSSGLGAIVAVMKMLAPDVRLELSGMCTTVAKVFSLTRMDQVFTIHNTVADAFNNN